MLLYVIVCYCMLLYCIYCIHVATCCVQTSHLELARAHGSPFSARPVEAPEVPARATEDFQAQLQKARQSTVEAGKPLGEPVVAAQLRGVLQVKKQLAEAQEQIVAERQNKESLQAREKESEDLQITGRQKS